MTDHLLQTKLFPPPLRPNFVPRPHLVNRLNLGLELGHKLTLISAPAGFGKTTLVGEWMADFHTEPVEQAQPANRLAWLSLDEADNDPRRFIAYLIGALNQVQKTKTMIGKGAMDMLQTSQSLPTEAILTTLINDIAYILDKIILVLDDYHLIDASPVDEALGFLLEHLPPQLHLVVATRHDPQLPLARLRARGQLTELRAADLRFATPEVAEFLNQVMALNLSDEDIAALETRTEGWIAGLQLAAISIQGRADIHQLIGSFTGSHRFVLDYLVEEVLQQQSENGRNFLLQTAILDRLTGSLCDALTGQDNGQAQLEQLEDANLFVVPLDQERRWYRYHHLFADLLRHQLHQKRPHWIPDLHLRASQWHEKNGFIDRAIEHAFCTNDFARAARLIEEHVDDIWRAGEHAKLRRWLVTLPGDLMTTMPALCIFHAWYLFASGQQELAESILQTAEQAVVQKREDSYKSSTQARLPGRIATVRAFMASFRGDIPAIIRQANKALAQLPEEELTWRGSAAITLGDAYGFQGDMAGAYQARLVAAQACRAAGDVYFLMIANLKLAITLRAQGQLQQTIAMCQQQIDLAEEKGFSQAPAVGWALAVWGEVSAELNDLDDALERAQSGLELAERGVDLAMIGWSYLCLVRVLFSRGELADAEAVIQKVMQLAQEADVPPWITSQMALWQVRLWLQQGHAAAALEWGKQHGLDSNGKNRLESKLHFFSLNENIVLARLLIAHGRLKEAIDLLQQMHEQAQAGGRTTSEIEILLLQATAFYCEKDSVQAMAALAQALTQAEPKGFIQIFVDEGPPMARLLWEAFSKGIAPNYVRRLLASFPTTAPDQVVSTASRLSGSGLIEPLTERELEVLTLIDKGFTNREIGDRLFLALNTIKAHTRNIYGKLDAHNRTQAVARARSLGVLPPV